VEEEEEEVLPPGLEDIVFARNVVKESPINREVPVSNTNAKNAERP
jgi:hypothetical protein